MPRSEKPTSGAPQIRCTEEGCEAICRFPLVPGGPREVCREHATLPYPDGPFFEDQQVTLELGLRGPDEGASRRRR